ncbi:hypothetical protein CJF30_00010876 [Rutstroemia sp. NJR-2017a BBW]|nr:hypothetical protein CJF30_00010876 [Rutstroemia sp. NJR-2017a BBW]
MLPIHKHPKS